MSGLNRREFLRLALVGGAAISLDTAIFPQPIRAGSSEPVDIGECRKVSIKCISELGWYDTKVLMSDFKKVGGPKAAKQYETPWTPSNAAGSSSLIEVEALDGTVTRILLDTGWDVNYMDQRFAATGVDKMLENGEIDFLYISHEHLDHFWGLEASLKRNKNITMMVPGTFLDNGYKFIEGADFPAANIGNGIKHEGKLIKHNTGGVHKLMPGVASVTFDLPIVLKIQGEQSLYFNVKDKGLVLVTGCCHQNIITFSDFAVNNIKGGDNLYGLYGGLHIAPFGALQDVPKGWIQDMAKYDFKKIACNHCTGLPAVEMMVSLGYPVVKGRGQDGSASDLYVGNGDAVSFG